MTVPPSHNPHAGVSQLHSFMHVPLVHCAAQAIEPSQVAKGFTRLMDSLDDLVLDVPDAVELLALFIARAGEV